MNISVGFDLAGMLLLIVICTFMIIFKQGKQKDGQTFFGVCVVGFVALLSDFLTWILDFARRPIHYYLAYFLNLILILAVITVVFLFNVHFYFKANNKNHFNLVVMYISIFFYVTFILIILACIPFNLIYKIDPTTNAYSKGPLYFIAYIFVQYFAFQNLIMVIVNRKNYKNNDAMRLIFLSLLAPLSLAIQVIVNQFIGDTTISYGLTSLGVAIVYINDQEFAIMDAGIDKMTGLPNRSNYLRMVDSDYKNLKSCGVIFFDINNLKNINDQFGHEAGDRIIVRVAQSIKELEASNINSFRIGGDEFVTIYTNRHEDEVEENIDNWKELMQIDINTYKFDINVAYGSSFADEDVNLEDLIKEADSAMYRNKIEYKQETKVEKMDK